MKAQTKKITATNWLDGAIAGFGAAAACAAFAFHSVFQSSGSASLSTVVNLAYPIGDALLLGLIAGGFAVLSGRRKIPWILLATGMSINVIGDAANVLQNSLGATSFGEFANAVAWPIAIVLMSMAVWIRPTPINPLIPERRAGFLLPCLAAAAALGILFAGTFYSIGRVAIALATLTLVAVGIRLIVSVRGVASLSQERHRQSVTDELTGLWNRRYLFRVLDAFFDEADETQTERSLAFLFVDLDHFKEINDSFGHPAGDELLRQLGDRLHTSLRDTDLLVRLGGDEFAVVLIDGDADYAASVADRLTASLDQPFMLDVVSATVGASIGIAVAPTDATDSARLVWCADVAMYRAKLGKVPYALFELTIDEEHDQMRLMEELGVAIDEGPARPPLPAPARPAQRRDAGRRGPDPVVSSPPGHAAAGQFRAHGRGGRADAAHYQVGDRDGHPAVRGVDGVGASAHRRRQRLAPEPDGAGLRGGGRATSSDVRTSRPRCWSLRSPRPTSSPSSTPPGM